MGNAVSRRWQRAPQVTGSLPVPPQLPGACSPRSHWWSHTMGSSFLELSGLCQSFSWVFLLRRGSVLSAAQVQNSGHANVRRRRGALAQWQSVDTETKRRLAMPGNLIVGSHAPLIQAQGRSGARDEHRSGGRARPLVRCKNRTTQGPRG